MSDVGSGIRVSTSLPIPDVSHSSLLKVVAAPSLQGGGSTSRE